MEVLDALRAIVGDAHVLMGAEAEPALLDWRGRYRGRALALLRPETNAEVAALVSHCARQGIGIVPQGGNTGLNGGATPDASGAAVVLSLARLKRIRSVDAANDSIVVEAGCVLQDVQRAAQAAGRLFPLSLGSEGSCTIGGNLATNAGGTQVLRYGSMRELCLGLEVVTAQGEIWHGLRTLRKDNTGYDLRDIYIGSEGTLGIITEITVRLYPQPEAISAAVCNFPTMHAAVQSVIEIIQMGVPVARVEFMDLAGVKAINAYSKLDLHESPLLLFEFHGSPNGVREQAQTVQEITAGNGGMAFEWAEHPEDRSRLWAARHNAYFAGLHTRPGSRSNTTDVCVPISRLADCVSETAAELEQASFPYIIVGHVGDGNFHVQMMLDPDNPAEWDESERINHNIVARAIAMDGTCTGEHGVGLHKMDFMLAEHGRDALDLMQSVKQAFDPNNILNPGKVIPPA